MQKRNSTPVGRYINRIRNKAKHDYALLYWVFITGHGPQPERPESLSYMGAQAVRLQLTKLTS